MSASTPQRYFEDLVPGESRESAELTVDGDEMLAFGQKYDPQYFHADPEAAKRSVFGAARTPNALDTRPGPGASAEDHLNWSRDTALGWAFSWFQNSQESVSR